MRLSIAAKINFFLLFIFSMVLVFSAAYQAVRERDLILTLIKEQSREQTEAYFDGLNMLMLTGKMDARDTLRAIERNKAILVKPTVAHAQWWMARLMPGLMNRMAMRFVAGQRTRQDRSPSRTAESG